MKNIRFPYRIFLSLLFLGALATFFTANSTSVTTHSTQTEMITPFPVVLELDHHVLQVVSAAQLLQLKLPDPETQQKMEPSFLLSAHFFTDGVMPAQAIGDGKSITNGNAITIPTNYAAQVSATVVDQMTQEVTVIYGDKANEDHLITAIYTANSDHYSPKVQYVKNILIWKTIFMNGMMGSIILPFIICKLIVRKRRKKAAATP